jgi:A/G-specific adenine glycosylase
LQRGVVEQLPIKGKRTPVKQETHVVVALERDGHHLFRRRPQEGLWGGLWELPSAVRNGESTYAAACQLLRTLDEPDASLRRSPSFRFNHQLTHRSIQFDVFVARTCSEPRRKFRNKNKRWLNLKDIDSLGLSTAMRRVVEAIIYERADSNGRGPVAMRQSRART